MLTLYDKVIKVNIVTFSGLCKTVLLTFLALVV